MAGHWTEVQRWENLETHEQLTAGELIKRFDRYLRINRVSLCCNVHTVRMEDGSRWAWIRDKV